MKILVLSAIILTTVQATEIFATPIRFVNGKCTEYRPRYEQVIKYRLIPRPSRVSDEYEALSKAEYEANRRNYHEAGKRIAQAVVIVEDKYGWKRAGSLLLQKRRVVPQGSTLSRIFGETESSCDPAGIPPN